MQAILVNEDKQLNWATVPDPEPSGSEVLIEIHATAVNRADLLQREGKYPPPPGWPEWMGLEVAGTVAALGPDCSERWKVGDQVCALLGGGGYAEKVVADESLLMPVPAGISMVEAASLPEVFATAWLNLVNEAHLQAGETVFVHAGASGVGIAALQIAKFLGAHTVTSVGGAAKVELMRELEVDRIVNHHEESVDAVFDECLANGSPINVVLDCVGGESLGINLSKLALEGRWILIATLGGIKTELALRPVLSRRLRLIGSTLRSRSLAEKQRILGELVEQLWPQFENGNIKPVVHQVLPIQQADAAHQILNRRENSGKFVLAIRDGAA